MAAVNELSLCGGLSTVRRATMGADQPRGWQIRRERKTPCYAARIDV